MITLKNKLNDRIQIHKIQIINFLVKSFAYTKIILLLSVLWFLFSGSKDYFMIICGIISVFFTFITCLIGKIISTESFVLRLYFLKYIFVLIKNIITSSFQLIKIIYSEKLLINPEMIIANTSNLTNQEKVLFSNSITMTPGTFVISVEKNSFLIHTIDKSCLNLKKNNEIANLLRKIKNI